MAPASTIPWIELAADISGVCRVAGTLLITSKPTQRLRIKMVRSVSRAVDIGGTSSGIGRAGRGIGRDGLRADGGRFGQGRMHDPAVMGDNHARLQVVVEVDGQCA